MKILIFPPAVLMKVPPVSLPEGGSGSIGGTTSCSIRSKISSVEFPFWIWSFRAQLSRLRHTREPPPSRIPRATMTVVQIVCENRHVQFSASSESEMRESLSSSYLCFSVKKGRVDRVQILFRKDEKHSGRYSWNPVHEDVYSNSKTLNKPIKKPHKEQLTSYFTQAYN